MKPNNQPHILNAASNLMGICFVLVTALKLSHVALGTMADEIAMVASLALMGSCVLSYMSMRGTRFAARCETWADYLFLIGSLCLFCAIALFATGEV